MDMDVDSLLCTAKLYFNINILLFMMIIIIKKKLLIYGILTEPVPRCNADICVVNCGIMLYCGLLGSADGIICKIKK